MRKAAAISEFNAQAGSLPVIIDFVLASDFLKAKFVEVLS